MQNFVESAAVCWSYANAH